MRGKDALVQAVVKSIAKKEDKPPETRSDDELRTLLRAKGEQTMQVRLLVEVSYEFPRRRLRIEPIRRHANSEKRTEKRIDLRTDSGTEN